MLHASRSGRRADEVVEHAGPAGKRTPARVTRGHLRAVRGRRVVLHRSALHRPPQARTPRWHAAARAATAVLLLAATLAACAGRNAVWVDPGSTRERVVFHISNGPGSTAPPSYFYGLTVMSCGGNVVLWTLRNSETASAARPARIVYGEPPRGYF